MRTVSAIARYLAGVIFLVFGLNGFLNFIPLRAVPPAPLVILQGYHSKLLVSVNSISMSFHNTYQLLFFLGSARGEVPHKIKENFSTRGF
jgi:hypothetical protein